MTQLPYEPYDPAHDESPYDYCDIPLPDDSDVPPESPYERFYCVPDDWSEPSVSHEPSVSCEPSVSHEPSDPPEAESQDTRMLTYVRNAKPDTIFSYLVPALDVEPSEHEFLLGDTRFPMGEVTIIAGSGGTGKGQLAAAHMACASRGYNLAGEKMGKPLDCLFITAEDTAEDVKRRLVRSEFRADGAHIFILDKESAFKYAIDLSDFDDTLRLDAMIRSLESPLVYIDPFQAFVGEHADLSRQNHVRHIMHALAALAERTHCCIVLIMHLNKRQSIANAAELLCGSSDIVNAARSVMLLTNDFRDGDPDRRYLFHIKSNHARRAKTLEFNISSGGNRIVGECEVDVDEYVNALNTRKLAKSGRTEVNYEQMFYDGIEKMIAEGETQSTFREFTQRFAQGFQGRAKCILDDITFRVEEKLGHTIQCQTSGSHGVKIGGERGFRLVKL